MDKRVYDHLKKKLMLTNSGSIIMSHSQIATELGTAREVITRVLKKLETDGKVLQKAGEIRIIGEW
jgi:CRP/FNR family transcriptional regulator